MANIRKELIVTGETYHIFNRSINKEEIFVYKRNLSRALELLNFYRYKQRIKYSRYRQLGLQSRDFYWTRIREAQPLVTIFAFSLMPNHFHLLLRQDVDDGIKHFLSNFQNGFAKYLNKKNDRDGSVFKRPFRSKRITADEEFLHVSRYIHLNPVTSYLLSPETLKDYPFNSFRVYVDANPATFIETGFILKLANGKDAYQKFVFDQVDYQRKLHLIKHTMLE